MPLHVPLQSPKLGPISSGQAVPASPQPVRWLTPSSPTVQPIQRSSTGPSFELVSNSNVRLDDYRLPRIMEEIAELSLAQLHTDVTVEPELDWLCADMYDPVHASVYDQRGGKLDVLVERPGNAVAGFIWYSPDDNDRVLYVKYLAVAERFKAFGCGRFLVSFAVDAARRSGARIRKVSLRALPAAIPFYQAIGFSIKCEEGDPGEMRMEMFLLPEAERGVPPSPQHAPASVAPFIFDDASLVYSAFDNPVQYAKPALKLPITSESTRLYDPTASWGDWPFANQQLAEAVEVANSICTPQSTPKHSWVVAADSISTPLSTPKHLPQSSPTSSGYAFSAPPPLSLAAAVTLKWTPCSAPSFRTLSPPSTPTCQQAVTTQLPTLWAQVQGAEGDPCPFSSVLKDVLTARRLSTMTAHSVPQNTMSWPNRLNSFCLD